MFKTTSKSLTLRPEAQLSQIRQLMGRPNFGSFANSPECLVLCGPKYKGPVAILWLDSNGGLNFTQVSNKGKIMRSIHSYEEVGALPGEAFTVSMLDTMIAENAEPKIAVTATPKQKKSEGGWSPARRAAYNRGKKEGRY